MTVEEIRAVYDVGPEAVIGLVERLLAIIAQQQEQISAQQAVIAAQELKIAALEARVKELEDRLTTNSRNSGKPPSSDGPDVKPHPKSQQTRVGASPAGSRGMLDTPWS